MLCVIDLLAVVTFVLAASTAYAQTQAPASGYLLPPKAIVDILDAPPPPTVELSPARDVVALLDRASMPTIAELSQPMLRLAGLRINPKTNGQHRSGAAVYPRYRSFTIKAVADGSRAESDAAAISVAGVDRLLARRQALRVHAASRQRHRVVDRRFSHGTGQVGHDRRN